MICPNCGREIETDSKFCEFCGTKIEASEPNFITCPKCNTQFPKGTKFCNQCGNSLEGTPTAYSASNSVVEPQPQQYVQQNNNVNVTNQYAQSRPPIYKLRTNRGLLKYILLSLVTFGIYGIVVLSKISSEINLIASKYDGRHTMHYCLIYFIFSWLTFGIAPLVWYHRISNRIGNELQRRRIYYDFSAADFWLWDFLGSLIIVGPFIYYYKFFKAMNLVAADYNTNG